MPAGAALPVSGGLFASGGAPADANLFEPQAGILYHD